MKQAILVLFFLANMLMAEPVILQSTTSTQNSGLYDLILPQFTDETGIEVRVLAVGTGQALRNAENCDADLLLVHARPAEEAFVEAGYGLKRFDLMYNDFIIVGPKEDPAEIQSASTAAEAFDRIASAEFRFMSRGDDSGTHAAERKVWEMSDAQPNARYDKWYLETGAGMGATLNTAVGLNAYALTDRATWLRFANRQDFKILFENDPTLFNQYGLVTINPSHCPNLNEDAANRLVEWLLGSQGQSAIKNHQISGQQLFFPNATP